MNEHGARLLGRFSQHAGRRRIDAMTAFHVVLGRVDRRVRRGIHHHARLQTLHERAELLGLLEVGLPAVGRDDVAERLQPRLQRASELTRRSDEQDRAWRRAPAQACGPARGSARSGKSASLGALASFGESSGDGFGHSMPRAGSFHASTCSASGR
jgi:hypothetical protein